MPATPNLRLRLLLETAGWSAAQLARAIGQVAAEHGSTLACDRSSVSRWLAGARPRPPAPEFLLEALSRRLDRPVTAGQAGLTRAPERMPPVSWEAAPLRALTLLTGAELDPARRTLLTSALFSPLTLAVPELLPVGPPGPQRRAPGRDRTGAADAARMDAMAEVFATTADRLGGGPVRAPLAAYLAHDVTARLHAPSSDAVRAPLLSRAAQLTLLLGRICADGGDDAVAQHYQLVAARLSADAGDHATLAIALRTMATHAHDLGHHGPVVLRLAERACEHARHAPPVVQAYTHAHLAVLQARHDRRAALAALDRAERLRGDDNGAGAEAGTSGPFAAYSLGALHYQRAQTLSALGDRSGAVRALTASLRARAPGERHARVLTHARLAEAQWGMGHLDEALPHWDAFLDAYPSLDSVRATRRLGAMRRRLRPHLRYPAAARLLGRADGLG
ncbi:helix-turn-helix transcriptional regulator [Streptomyces yaizuensis]|uniref:Helix-turn-helix transcriptional regulator n=1 Tax=Streptomyces yaizuensis TaxID=2989713 RepID=A0ABQ5P5Q0_9ACTN|nr:helix-turn-helix transcriptional regulator [Streptomyces sp. YSPA8]GLF97916.1 helix-turn-helix transcriptional regulator [Streptomyces sp. YSPA8]